MYNPQVTIAISMADVVLQALVIIQELIKLCRYLLSA